MHQRIVLRVNGEQLPCVIRNAEAGDEALIFDAWLQSYRQSEFAKVLGNHVYFTNHHKTITELLKRPGTVVRCIVQEDTNWQVLGWMCAEPASRVVHYAATKKTWREMGVARALLASFAIEHGWPPDSEIEFTHRTFYVDKVTQRSPHYLRRFRFNPYGFFNIKEAA